MQKDNLRIRGTTPEIEEAAKQLRKNLTPAEAKLWEALKNRQLSGIKFRCQHPVGRFIADFYCASHKLVIEIDGEIHQHQQEYDQVRTELFQIYGYKVLRFTNKQVLNDLQQVLNIIIENINALTPSPSPNSGRGEQED